MFHVEHPAGPREIPQAPSAAGWHSADGRRRRASEGGAGPWTLRLSHVPRGTSGTHISGWAPRWPVVSRRRRGHAARIAPSASQVPSTPVADPPWIARLVFHVEQLALFHMEQAAFRRRRSRTRRGSPAWCSTWNSAQRARWPCSTWNSRGSASAYGRPAGALSATGDGMCRPRRFLQLPRAAARGSRTRSACPA
jgi:hypothetical protein